ncbi:glycosyltransferase family 2 protein [Rhodopirellula sp. JC639]|uniref:glycosyltransferase family 2 protein n=1 Tax=Stieleria mannarensis TaxID=2755585 RepID=UPI001601500F|nr:glycosyltransferase family 2 protein [Rhodopirellula sp. JC639]
MSPTRLSIVLPVRDRQDEIAQRVESVLEGLVDLTSELAEVIVVDDGSRDDTRDILEMLHVKYPQVRIARHDRPRGMEAAGQTGLERATGELVFIQESDSEMRMEDVRRLLLMSEDESVVAARAESRQEPIAPALLRRLRQWGTDKHTQVELRADQCPPCSVQMIRKPHLQRLSAPRGKRYWLQGQTDRIHAVERAEDGPREKVGVRARLKQPAR